MTAEALAQEETQTAAEVVVAAQEGKVVAEGGDVAVKAKESVEETKPKTVEKSYSYKEESNYLSDLKEFEKKSLSEFKAKLEEAISGNTLFEKEEVKKEEASSTVAVE